MKNYYLTPVQVVLPADRLIRFFLFCLFLLPVSAGAQQPSAKYDLLLKSGIVKPQENLQDFIDRPNIKQAKIFKGKYFKFIQFYEIPTQDDRKKIEELGIQLLHYIPNKTFAASIPENLDLSLLNDMDIRSVINIEAGYKIDDRLKEPPYPKWAFHNDRSIDIVVQYYKNIDPESVKTAFRKYGVNMKYGINIISTYDYTNLITIRINVLEIENIASFPFVSWVEPIAAPSVPDDTKGRTLHRANVIDADHLSGRHYNGSGVSVALGDDGPIGPHIDYKGRIDQSNATANTGDHGDMTSGILMGAGNLDPTIKGMASGAFIYVYDIGGYNHILDAPVTHPTLGVMITSTSYSQGCNVGYTTDASSGDQMIRQNPSLIHVFSAGNSGTSECTSDPYGAGPGWGNVTGGYKQAKNTIAVGNLDYKDVLLNSSSRGPAADGRIKPDICANGAGQLSTDDPNTYQVGGGTSAACPSIAGVLAQLYQAYRELNSGTDPESPLLKAFLLNTAEDLGNPGPDFSFGWGRVNAFRAVKTLEDNRYMDSTIGQGGTNTHIINIPAGTKQLRVMLYWLDYEGAPAASPALVNDLNMKVTVPDTIGTMIDPWVLDPTPNPANLDADAVRAVDNLNNMEQVTIDNPLAGNHTITVTGFQVPQGPQKYYIVYEFLNDEISLTYPIGGEGFVSGETETIRWDAYGNTGTFSLEYSPDNGISWSTIGAASSTRRYYEWTVPSVLTGQALVRVTRSAFSDVSDTVFSIIEVPQNLTINWACPDSIQLSWDPVSGATGYEISMLGSMYMDSIGTSVADSFVVYGINPLLEYWFSVKALGPNNAKGRRAIAIQKIPGTFDCNIPIDAALTEIINPTGGTLQNCQDYSSVSISVQLYNFGTDTISNIPLHYQVNSGPVVNDTFPNILTPGSSAIHVFSSTENFSGFGFYNLSAWASYPSDGNSYNDVSQTMVQTVAGILVNLPWSEDFETFALCATTANCEVTSCNLANGWINEVNLVTDDIEWRTDNGGTSSNNTGPSTDHAPGTAAGNYLYLEASGDCNFKTAHLITPCIDLTTAALPELNFWYHMYGADMGEWHLDVLQGGAWTNDIISPVTGNQGNSWQQAIVNLSPYAGQIINLRFRGVTGLDYQSDMAIDDIVIFDEQGPPITNFIVDNANTCIGETVTFTDMSLNAPNSWSWSFSPGTVNFVNATTANSQNPQVQFTALGFYDVTLTTSNAYGSNPVTKTSYIIVDLGAAIPFVEDFESGIFPPAGWNIVDPGGSETWDERSNVTGSDGVSTTTAYINNFTYFNTGAEDELIVVSINLTGKIAPLMTFDVAYVRYSAALSDELRIDISTDCGATYKPTGYNKSGSVLATAPDTTGNWFPYSASQWRNDTINLSAYTDTVVRIKFVNINGYGNNLFIDNINIIDTSTIIISEITEVLSFSNDIEVYPNPSSGIFNLSVRDIRSSSLELFVTDVLGRNIYSRQFSDLKYEFKTQIDLSKFTSGIYFLLVITGDKQYVEKLDVQ